MYTANVVCFQFIDRLNLDGWRSGYMEGIGARLHRRTSPFILLDAVILAVLLASHVTIFGFLLSSIASVVGASALLYVVFRAYSFRRMRLGSLSQAMNAFYVLFTLYVAIGIIDFLAAGLIGDGWLFIQAFLVLLLARSCLQRRRALDDPRFRSWWTISTGEDVLGIELSEGELLATCPSCASMLAVIPEKLEEGDLCPICGKSLTGG